jgi:CrcB protein
MNLKGAFLVGIGGAAGSIARYAVGATIEKSMSFPFSFPIVTFGINVIGSLLIGLLFGFSMRGNNWLSQDLMLLLAVGFCGGFTTFSTFAIENVQLLHKGQFSMVFAYSWLSVISGLLLCRLGAWISS